MSHALAADVEPQGGEFRVHARRAVGASPPYLKCQHGSLDPADCVTRTLS